MDETTGQGAPTSRQEAARLRAELGAQDARAESARAQVLVDAFVDQATRRGITPTPLRATLHNGSRVRTDKQGWYLRRNESIAIGTDGSYYQLVVPGGLAERLRGVRLHPSDPPLVVGRGGRDGESGDLSWFLEQRLARGNG